MSELIDNRAHRVRTLKEIITHLHSGQPADEVKERLREIVKETDYSEIVAMEQQLLADGMPVEEIQCMCDLHSQVTRDVLVQIPTKAVPPGHPLDTFRRENEALRGVLATMRKAMEEIQKLDESADAQSHILTMRQAFNDVMDIEKHYQRKENTLFPCLERHEITGPPKVMWAKDDEVRGLLKALGAALQEQQVSAAHWKAVASGAGESAVKAVEEMIYKEENILLPMCQDIFTEDDWAGIWVSSPRYGWCLVEPRKGYEPPAAVVKEGLKLAAAEVIQLPTGNLSLEQLLGIFTNLPVDVTFVDADDRVAFFSEGPDRIFARSTAIIGRKVQHCHPPKSVHIVDQIVSDFRARRQNVAEFWITLHGKFVHIRYFAVRDAKGEYLGTLEVTQDATRIRALEGERRLLEYEDMPKQAEPHPVAAPVEGVPAWVSEDQVRYRIDADEMLATGEHPIGKIRQWGATLETGKIIRLASSFRPVPLIDTMSRSGFAVYSTEISPGKHVTYFSRQSV